MSKTLVHYDIVGSFLRPEELKKARADFAAGNISKTDLKKVEDEEIAKLVKKEEKAGLKIVTDGEFRRSYWHLDTFGASVELSTLLKNMATSSTMKKLVMILLKLRERLNLQVIIQI